MDMIMGLRLVFYVLFCKPVDVVEGIYLRACCFDGGVWNVGVGGGWVFSKGVGMFITNNTGMGLHFEEVDGRWWLADCYSNGSKDISMDVAAMKIRVWELILIWCSDVWLSVAICE